MDFEKRIWNAIKIMNEKHNYNPTILIDMINKYGGIEAVQRLINSSEPTYGYTKLWELKALDLSLEAIILEKEWFELFTEGDRIKARNRLKEYGYTPTTKTLYEIQP